MMQKLMRRQLTNVRHISEMSTWKSFANVDPWTLSKANPHVVKNSINGQWSKSKNVINLPDPLKGEEFIQVSDTRLDEIEPFVQSLNTCSRTGLHNPFKSPQRYLQYGSISAKAAAMLNEPENMEFFIKLIQRVAPKSYAQARAEVSVTQKFLENFGGDQVRFLARSFQVPGDHDGQMSSGYRWPYGPVTIIAPFNFPLEIPILQLMGALFMGNKVLLKCCSRVSIVMEQALRMLHQCGLPAADVDLINCDGPVMHQILLQANPRMTQFTGSSKVAELLARDLHGRIKIEDAGWDWKILGPDVHDVDYVAFVADQDAYAYSGQKCSAQSALFVHENWTKAGFLDKIKRLAEQRSLDKGTVSPILTVTNATFQQHVRDMLSIPGAKVLFGGGLLENHSIPACYGSFQPTAIQVPMSSFLQPQFFDICKKEIFGPFQVVVEYSDAQLDGVLATLEKTDAYLTAAVVSRDIQFQNKVLAHTINGTTYSGIRARTTGAPQNHWFGPAGDPRGAGIGTPEAIKLVWSCHREIVFDQGPVAPTGTTPEST